jgi:hypothetical protein
MFKYLIFETPIWANDSVKQMLAHMYIHSRQGIIQQVNVAVLVHSSGQTHSLLLTTTQVDTLIYAIIYK